MLWCVIQQIALINIFQWIQRPINGYLKCSNDKKHTAHTIVSWQNPEQWIMNHISDLVMITRFSIITLIIGFLYTQIGYSGFYHVHIGEKWPYYCRNLQYVYMYPVDCRYNAVQNSKVLHTLLQELRRSINQVSFVNICEKIDRFITAPHCIHYVYEEAYLPF